MGYIISAILASGLWAVSQKLALRGGSPQAVFLINGVVYGATVPFVWGWMHSKSDSTPVGVWLAWAAAAAILGMVANLSFLSAMNTRPTTEVMSWTQLYPLVTYVLCVFFLGERVTPLKCLGAGLMLAGAFIMNR